MTELGTVLDGKYEILKKVGQGGMSIVYLALDNRLNKQWAVKEIKNDGSKSTATLLKGLEREANILKDVDHPVLPRIVDIINENGTIYVVMDYVEGKALSEVLKEEGAQSQDKVIEWAKALASALDYLHSMNPPIIYRDMKPSNVMLKPDGSVKLIDFGTAKEYIVENNADTTALGTRGYAAPEQFGDAQGRGIYNTDARTDIYNLGATLYHLVTGKNPCEPPYEIKPIRQWNPMLSSGFEQIIAKCCQPSPQDRYQSCSELLYALDHYNELDDEYKAKAKGKLAAFGTMIGLSVVCAGCAIFGGVKKQQLNELNYNNKISEAQEAVDNGSYAKAFECYKDAVELDSSRSDAYIGYMDTYAYYYKEDETASGQDSPAEKGIRFALKYVDDVEDDVLYEIAILYFNEVKDFSAARKYFNMVEDSEQFPEEVEQARYYSALCNNRINKSSNFDDTKEDVYAFQSYNSESISDTDTYKYVNYLNIAQVYVEQLSTDEELAERTIALMEEANEKLNENSTVLSNEFPDDRGVNYYNCQYSTILYTVYEKLAEDETDTAKQLTYYQAMVDSANTVIANIAIGAEDVSDTDISTYVKYVNNKAGAYENMAIVTGDDTYYEYAETTYESAESSLGTNDYVSDVYIAHLTYLNKRYKEEFGEDPTKWSKSARSAISAVYNSGDKVEILSSGSKPQWNSLRVDQAISAIINGSDTDGGNESE